VTAERTTTERRGADGPAEPGSGTRARPRPAPTTRPSSSPLFPTARCAAFDVRPLARETTLSFVERLAHRLGAGARDLIAEFFAFDNRRSMHTLRTDGEVYFNADARARFAALCDVPPEHLERALPAWTRLEPIGRHDAGPAADFRAAGSIAPTAAGCTRCVAARTGRAETARLYTEAHQHVCARHATWLSAATGDDRPAPAASGRLSLIGLPRVVRAGERHARLLRRREDIADAFPVAQAVTATWWDAHRPQESVWPRRLRRLAAANPGNAPARDLARDVITYPETVALAALLASRFWQQRILDDIGNHRPHTPADTPAFTRELASRLGRPWLVSALAEVDTGPLNAWIRACWRSRAGERTGRARMWRVPPAYRVRKTAPPRAGTPSPTRDDAVPGAWEQGFVRRFALAREFADEHGHLCIPYNYQCDGIRLGQWMANLRAKSPELAPEHSRALAALDPGWSRPWSTRWQRLYLRARRLADAGAAVDPEQGFDAFSENLGTWLFQQCLKYESLHPRQRELLTDIGIPAHSARHARRRARSMQDARTEYLDHAHAYWERHRHLCARSTETQAGYPIGQTLSNLRIRARLGKLDPRTARELTSLDPWWAAPWPHDWQRACYAVRDLVHHGHTLDPKGGFAGLDDEPGQWLYTQCVTYRELADEQRRQLAVIGLTDEAAATAKPNPATRKPGLETGLHYARSHVALHGDLDVAPSARHQGFPLGAWLARQRRQAALHAAKFTSPWPAGPSLAALDPCWSPPWNTEWQVSYHSALRHVETGLRLIPARGFPGTPDWTGQWLYTQCLAYTQLHPEQRRRLARLGITAANAPTARPRRVTQQASFDAGLDHARSFAARTGHLAAPQATIHNGYRLGHWLAGQRRRATDERLPRERVQALDAVDPWWNPPWGLPWQITYHRVETAIRGLTLEPAAGFPGLATVDAKWLLTQCVNHDTLHRGQHLLLAALGITADTARAARPRYEARPRPAVGTARPRPTTVSSSIDGGLPYARSYAHAHNGLGTAHHDVEHDGFPLGWWLHEQRKRANAHARRTGRRWPHEHALTALDPWWNPPWRISWQHSYTHARTNTSQGRRPTQPQRKWLALQHRNWHTLHPDQRTLLTTAGLNPPRTTRPSRTAPTTPAHHHDTRRTPGEDPNTTTEENEAAPPRTPEPQPDT